MSFSLWRESLLEIPQRRPNRYILVILAGWYYPLVGILTSCVVISATWPPSSWWAHWAWLWLALYWLYLLGKSTVRSRPHALVVGPSGLERITRLRSLILRARQMLPEWWTSDDQRWMVFRSVFRALVLLGGVFALFWPLYRDPAYTVAHGGASDPAWLLAVLALYAVCKDNSTLAVAGVFVLAVLGMGLGMLPPLLADPSRDRELVWGGFLSSTRFLCETRLEGCWIDDGMLEA